jgi:hypothetical protein
MMYAAGKPTQIPSTQPTVDPKEAVRHALEKGTHYRKVRSKIAKPPLWYEDAQTAIDRCLAADPELDPRVGPSPTFSCSDCRDRYYVDVMIFVAKRTTKCVHVNPIDFKTVEASESPVEVCFLCARKYPYWQLTDKLLSGIKHQG